MPLGVAERPTTESTPNARRYCALFSCPPSGGYYKVEVGEKFKEGRYTALYPLGQGHYSTVWMVLDEQTGETAAMKVRRLAG